MKKTVQNIGRKFTFAAAALGLSLLTPAAKGQIISSSVNITNTSVSAPIQFQFTPTTASEFINVQQHSAQISNVTTNETIYLSYGRQPQGNATTNLNQFASITTNFNAAWCAATFGYTTNNFSTVIIFPALSSQQLDSLWGTFSNALGSNSVSFF
jgi:hypothetical protein